MPGHDGLPNLRPGSMPGMLRSQARLYDPELDLHELFDDFIDLSASIITDDTALDYRRCFDQFAAFVVDETRQQRAEAALRAAESATNEQDRKALLARIPEIATEPVRVTLEVIDERWCVAYIANLQRRPKKKGEGTLSDASVNTYVRPLRTFVRWLVERGYCGAPPSRGRPRRRPMGRTGLRRPRHLVGTTANRGIAHRGRPARC